MKPFLPNGGRVPNLICCCPAVAPCIRLSAAKAQHKPENEKQPTTLVAAWPRCAVSQIFNLLRTGSLACLENFKPLPNAIRRYF
jgi:hypothetical protein